MKDCIETWLPSLWHPEQEITNIFSGCKAAIEMRDEIVGNLKKSGKSQCDEFLKGVTTIESEKSYCEPISLNYLKKKPERRDLQFQKMKVSPSQICSYSMTMRSRI